MHLYRVSVTLWLKIAPVLDYGALLKKRPREGVRYFLEVSNKQPQTANSGGMCWTKTKQLQIPAQHGYVLDSSATSTEWKNDQEGIQ